MTKLRDLYPPIEPYEQQMLPVGDGHEIYLEQCGNPDGKPVVFLHGGPGGGCQPDSRRFFDPERYRIVLFDQRMAGRSTPHAWEPEADFSANTTWHLVADIERVREHLGIDAWQVFGGSWGSALSLAYAQAHRDRVRELVLRGIFTLRRSELEWMYEAGHLEHVYPDYWADYVAPVPPEKRSAMMHAYHDLLFDPDPAVHVPAGKAWSGWEGNVTFLRTNQQVLRSLTEDKQAVTFARIENHYFVNRGFFDSSIDDDAQLIHHAHLLRGIPTVIVQGRYDMCTPARTAFELAAQLPDAEFVLVPDAGHAATEPGNKHALIEATDRFASR